MLYSLYLFYSVCNKLVFSQAAYLLSHFSSSMSTNYKKLCVWLISIRVLCWPVKDQLMLSEMPSLLRLLQVKQMHCVSMGIAGDRVGSWVNLTPSSCHQLSWLDLLIGLTYLAWGQIITHTNALAHSFFQQCTILTVFSRILSKILYPQSGQDT